MGDEGYDLGYCAVCGEFRQVVYSATEMRCLEHAKPRKPFVLVEQDFDLIFDKANVPGPKRHRIWESITGILFFSKKHHAQAKAELEAQEKLC